MLISNGHSYDDTRDKYTITQVYLFAEKIRKMVLDKDRMSSIVMANCLLYAAPANDRAEARRKGTEFQKFLDSLNWDNLIKDEEEKQKPKNAEDVIKRLFGGVKLPIKIKTKK